MAQLDALLKTYGVKRETLKRVVSEKHRNTLAQGVGGDWESLATFIGVPRGDIDDIKDEYRKPLDRRLAMMRRWHELWGEEATYLLFVEGLRQIGRRDLIQNVLNDCKSHDQLSSLVNKASHKDIPLMVVIVIVFLLTIMIMSTIKPRDSVSHGHINTTRIEHVNYLSDFHVQTIKYDHKAQINCSNSPESDLPIIHPLFVGRENDMHQVLRRVATAHIVNINGAPGFGKSTLAIHVGYEIFKNGTSVRYVNVEDKLFYYQCKSNKKATPTSDSNANVTVAQTHKSSRSLTKLSRSSLSISRSQSLELSSQNENLFDELQRWSETIKCNNVLILDNCDDILISNFRQKFLKLINVLVKKSNFKLHIIIVSRERLLFLDSFDYWTVRELNQSASVELLDRIAPAIDNQSLNTVAKLVEGCPLALKVIGQLFHIRGVQLVHKVKKGLISTLDEVSDQEQRFRVIMDVAFNRLGILKECGFVLSLFPGSFDETAGNAIVQKECWETYLKHSLLNEYSLAFNYRYKMHRLIKEYLQEKVSTSENITFITKFKTYFEELLLTNEKRQDESDAQKYTLSLDLHNLHYLKELLLIESHLSSKELAVLAFLSDLKLIQPEQLHRHHLLYIRHIDEVCPYLNPNLCGQLYTNIFRYLYQQCKCETLSAYIQNIFNSPCINYFQCHVVSYLQDLYASGLVHLSEDESSYIHLVVGSHCNGGYYTTKNPAIGSKEYLYVSIILSLSGTLLNCLLFHRVFHRANANRCCKFLLGCASAALSVKVTIAFFIGIIMLFYMIIQPALLIFELNIRTAARHLRILEIISKSVCQYNIIVSFITMMFICTFKSVLPIILRLSTFTTNVIVRNCVISCDDSLIWFTVSSIILLVHLSIPHYCCQFIPLCV